MNHISLFYLFLSDGHEKLNDIKSVNRVFANNSKTFIFSITNIEQSLLIDIAVHYYIYIYIYIYIIDILYARCVLIITAVCVLFKKGVRDNEILINPRCF